MGAVTDGSCHPSRHGDLKVPQFDCEVHIAIWERGFSSRYRHVLEEKRIGHRCVPLSLQRRPQQRQGQESVTGLHEVRWSCREWRRDHTQDNSWSASATQKGFAAAITISTLVYHSESDSIHFRPRKNLSIWLSERIRIHSRIDQFRATI